MQSNDRKLMWFKSALYKKNRVFKLCENLPKSCILLFWYSVILTIYRN